MTSTEAIINHKDTNNSADNKRQTKLLKAKARTASIMAVELHVYDSGAARQEAQSASQHARNDNKKHAKCEKRIITHYMHANATQDTAGASQVQAQALSTQNLAILYR